MIPSTIKYTRLALAFPILLVFLLLISLLAACGALQPASGSPIRVEDPWARPAAAMGMETGEMAQPAEGGMQHGAGSNSAVYLRIHNEGQDPVRLINAQAEVSQVVELHETTMEGDVMKMQQVQGGIEVPAGGQVELKPGGLHVMLIGLTQDLEVGNGFPVTLEFDDGTSLTVEATVRQP
jgi:copper(I)-binding protein